MKNLKYTVNDKMVTYTAEHEEKPISGQFSLMYCQPVESKLLTAICECHVLDCKTFKLIMAHVAIDWSKQKRPISFEYRQWFEASLKLASTIKANDKAGILNGIVYKKSENGRYQLMPAWYYLTGNKKAFINYCQTDFNLKVSKYDREQAKKMALPKADKVKASPVTVKAIESVNA